MRTIWVESPGGGGSLFLQRYAPALEVNVEEYAAEFRRNTDAEVQKLGVGPVRPFSATSADRKPIRWRVAGELRDGVEQSFTVELAGEPVKHRARFFRIENRGACTFLGAQATSQDWAGVEPGFDLVLDSFQMEPRS